MTLRLNNLRVEAADPRLLAQFWIKALGWQLVHGSNEAVLVAPSSQRPLPPECLAVMFYRGTSDKVGRNRLIFDLAPTDRENELHRLVQLGATAVDADPGDDRWTLMADPEGNEFCVLHTVGQMPKRFAPQ